MKQQPHSSHVWRALTLLGIALSLTTLLVVHFNDRQVLGRGQRLDVSTPDGERLFATYYAGTRPAGVVLLEGFGSDYVTLRSLAMAFACEGVHVFVFDFSGHGRSPGALGFDNAATDRLAHQVSAAVRRFQAVSGLETEDIVLLGHSMGARVALQAATLEKSPAQRVAGLVLLGTQVNLGTNVQSQVFTGVRDAGLAWVQALGSETPPTNVALISGTWDDILTPQAARALVRKLTGESSVDVGHVYGDPNAGRARVLVLLPALIHNYEVFAPRALVHAKQWAGLWWALSLEDVQVGVGRVIAWVSALLGVVLALIAGNRWGRSALPPMPAQTYRVRVLAVSRFLWGKLLLWLPALPFTALLFGLFFVVPLGLPAFNMIYVGFIGAYGLLLLVLYALGRMPGTEGHLPFVDAPHAQRPVWRWALAVGIAVGIGALMTLYARSGWFYMPPVNARLVWLVLFTPVTALGFWMGARETVMLDLATGGRRARWGATLIGLVPFFLWTLFQLGIGSLSGVIGGVQGLIILAWVLLEGALLQQIVGVSWVVAVLQAVLLYMLILPQGVLFAM